MKTDDFEGKLQRQPLRQIPVEWRESILRTAREQAAAPAQRPKPVLIRAVVVTWRELLQPCRYAWSGMAALWLILWMVNAHMRPEETPGRSATSTPVASERIRLWEEQRRVLAELSDPIALPSAEPARPAPPKPHTERSLEIRRC